MNDKLFADDSSMVTDPCFLQEHMILNGSTSTCVFDTPGWSIFAEENYKILQKWMKNGVCHGDMDIWYHDIEFI